MFFLKIGYAHSIQTPRRSSIPWPALRCGTGDGHSTLTMGLNQQKLRFNRKHGMMMMMMMMMMNSSDIPKNIEAHPNPGLEVHDDYPSLTCFH